MSPSRRSVVSSTPAGLVALFLSIRAAGGASTPSWHVLTAADFPAPQDAAPAKPDAVPPKPPTHKVTLEPIRVEVTLDGVFEAAEMKEITLRPEVWGELVVIKAAEHGARVAEGDVLLSLETKKIDEAILDAEKAQELAALGLRQAEIDLRTAEELLPLDISAAERSARQAEEDLRWYLETERALALKATKNSLKNAMNYLEYEQEELRQLEKMYKADDLTEETEEIILKRQRDTVEQAKFAVERAKASHDETLKFTIPRQDLSQKEAARRQALAKDRAKSGLKSSLAKQRIDFEKTRCQVKEGSDRLKKLRKDRELLTVRSPMDGFVYYGRCLRGAWGDTSMLVSRLRRGGALQPQEPVMTVVRPRPLFVRGQVPEREIHHVRAGVKGDVQPTGYPDLKLAARVDEVSLIPLAPGAFLAKIRVQMEDGAGGVVPGMTCKIKLVPYSRKKAIVVPSGAVFAEEPEGDGPHVYVFRAGGGHEKRPVKAGKRLEGKVEILEGLKEGEEILLERPAVKPEMKL